MAEETATPQNCKRCHKVLTGGPEYWPDKGPSPICRSCFAALAPVVPDPQSEFDRLVERVEARRDLAINIGSDSHCTLISLRKGPDGYEAMYYLCDFDESETAVLHGYLDSLDHAAEKEKWMALIDKASQNETETRAAVERVRIGLDDHLMGMKGLTKHSDSGVIASAALGGFADGYNIFCREFGIEEEK